MPYSLIGLTRHIIPASFASPQDTPGPEQVYNLSSIGLKELLEQRNNQRFDSIDDLNRELSMLQEILVSPFDKFTSGQRAQAAQALLSRNDAQGLVDDGKSGHLVHPVLSLLTEFGDSRMANRRVLHELAAEHALADLLNAKVEDRKPDQFRFAASVLQEYALECGDRLELLEKEYGKEEVLEFVEKFELEALLRSTSKEQASYDENVHTAVVVNAVDRTFDKMKRVANGSELSIDKTWDDIASWVEKHGSAASSAPQEQVPTAAIVREFKKRIEHRYPASTDRAEQAIREYVAATNPAFAYLLGPVRRVDDARALNITVREEETEVARHIQSFEARMWAVSALPTIWAYCNNSPQDKCVQLKKALLDKIAQLTGPDSDRCVFGWRGELVQIDQYADEGESDMLDPKKIEEKIHRLAQDFLGVRFDKNQSEYWRHLFQVKADDPDGDDFVLNQQRRFSHRVELELSYKDGIPREHFATHLDNAVQAFSYTEAEAIPEFSEVQAVCNKFERFLAKTVDPAQNKLSHQRLITHIRGDLYELAHRSATHREESERWKMAYAHENARANLIIREVEASRRARMESEAAANEHADDPLASTDRPTPRVAVELSSIGTSKLAQPTATSFFTQSGRIDFAQIKQFYRWMEDGQHHQITALMRALTQALQLGRLKNDQLIKLLKYCAVEEMTPLARAVHKGQIGSIDAFFEQLALMGRKLGEAGVASILDVRGLGSPAPLIARAIRGKNFESLKTLLNGFERLIKAEVIGRSTLTTLLKGTNPSEDRRSTALHLAVTAKSLEGVETLMNAFMQFKRSGHLSTANFTELVAGEMPFNGCVFETLLEDEYRDIAKVWIDSVVKAWDAGLIDVPKVSILFGMNREAGTTLPERLLSDNELGKFKTFIYQIRPLLSRPSKPGLVPAAVLVNALTNQYSLRAKPSYESAVINAARSSHINALATITNCTHYLYTRDFIDRQQAQLIMMGYSKEGDMALHWIIQQNDTEMLAKWLKRFAEDQGDWIGKASSPTEHRYLLKEELPNLLRLSARQSTKNKSFKTLLNHLGDLCKRNVLDADELYEILQAPSSGVVINQKTPLLSTWLLPAIMQYDEKAPYVRSYVSKVLQWTDKNYLSPSQARNLLVGWNRDDALPARPRQQALTNSQFYSFHLAAQNNATACLTAFYKGVRDHHGGATADGSGLSKSARAIKSLIAVHREHGVGVALISAAPDGLEGRAGKKLSEVLDAMDKMEPRTIGSLDRDPGADRHSMSAA